MGPMLLHFSKPPEGVEAAGLPTALSSGYRRRVPRIFQKLGLWAIFSR